jgi:hypothetical protein
MLKRLADNKGLIYLTLQQIDQMAQMRYCTYLLLREYVDMALDTVLAHIRPAVTRHPFSFAFRAFIFTKTAFFALIRSQTLAFRTCLHSTAFTKEAEELSKRYENSTK